MWTTSIGRLGGMTTDAMVERKRACRKELEARRRQLTDDDRHRFAASLADVVLGLPELERATTVTAYVGVGAEPGTGPLLAGLRARGTRVLLPITNRDMTLDWAEYTGDDDLATARYGLHEPTGTRLGPSAAAEADVVLVPALAVDEQGIRLGRGGGCYDRVLTMLPPTTVTCALLHPGEVLPEVPAEPHDARVAMACTPDQVVRFPLP